MRRCRIRNTGTGGGTRWGMRFTQTGATAAVGMVCTDNHVWDDQGVVTSRACLITGTFNYSKYADNLLKDLVDTLSGTLAGTGSVHVDNIAAT